ncbi:serine--tRNA ligase [bacterium]|nr:serine--tRNA ligase [bacterium]
MLDQNFVAENRSLVEEGLRQRGGKVDDLLAAVARICELNAERKKLVHEGDTLRHESKELSANIAAAMKAKDPQGETLKVRSKELKEREKEVARRQAEVEKELDLLLLTLPNLPHKDAIRGGPEANTPRRTWGTRKTFDFEPKEHMALCEKLGIVDLQGRGVKVAGSGFVLWRALGAKLERALVNWMLDLHVREHGYLEVSPPFVVNTETMTGTGQLPKFDEELYKIERDGLWLIPTAEVPVTNLHADEIIPQGDLPITYCAYTPCFRREAGAAGKMTRGLRRVHQFDKVELVRLVRPETSDEEHRKLLSHCTRVLELLGLEHRVLELASGDTGFSAARCYDLECWAPASKEWLEVSSVSTFTDFQARRAGKNGIRFRDENQKTRLVHTLNGSGVACPRVVLCLLETYQKKDGSVEIPDVLRPYMGGIDAIR